MPKLRVWIGLAVAGTAILCMAGGVTLCENALHVPRNLPRAMAHCRQVQVTARDGAVLKAWLLMPAAASGDYVLTLHGIADCRSGTAGLARMFAENHYTVL